MSNHKPTVVMSNDEHPAYCRLCGVPVDQRTARNGRTVTTHARTEDRFPILGDDLRPIAEPTTVETITVEQVTAGDSISVQGGREGSFFTVKSIRDGLRKGIGFRTTDGEYTGAIPFGTTVVREVR